MQLRNQPVIWEYHNAPGVRSQHGQYDYRHRSCLIFNQTLYNYHHQQLSIFFNILELIIWGRLLCFYKSPPISPCTDRVNSYNMPVTRSALIKTTPNRHRGFELNPYQRGRILGRADSGQKASVIACLEITPIRTIYSMIQKDSQRHEGKSLGRRGRSLEYTEADEQCLLSYVRAHPKHTWKEVLNSLNFSFSKTTYKRILHKHNNSK